MRRLWVVAVALLVLAACSPAELYAHLVNGTRSAEGRPVLPLCEQGWQEFAQRRAEELRAAGRLFHLSKVPDGLVWNRVGENVGYAQDMLRLHSAYLGSPAHRANVLNPGWRCVAVGVAPGVDRVWQATLFVG